MDPQTKLFFRSCQLSHKFLGGLPQLPVRNDQNVGIGPGAVGQAVEALGDGRVEVGASVEDLFEEPQEAVDARGVLSCFCYFVLERRERERKEKREESNVGFGGRE